MRISFIVISFFILIFSQNVFSQSASEQDSIEVNVIDSFVTPELPHTFILSFFTSEKAKSKVIIENKYIYNVSDSLTENHKVRIDISSLKFKEQNVPYYVVVTDSTGHQNRSDVYTFELPKEVKIQGESNFYLLCLFGATVFLLPYPSMAITKDKNYFSLTKEIPLISIRKQGFSYPAGYISLEYTHIFNGGIKNIVRLGYKDIIETPFLQYISPGADVFTNFNGFNGLSPELSVGLFKIFDTFIVYARYRYNFKPGDSRNDFHEIGLGLYSNFFSLYL